MGGMIQSMELISTVFSPALHSYKPQIQPNLFEKTEQQLGILVTKFTEENEFLLY